VRLATRARGARAVKVRYRSAEAVQVQARAQRQPAISRNLLRPERLTRRALEPAAFAPAPLQMTTHHPQDLRDSKLKLQLERAATTSSVRQRSPRRAQQQQRPVATAKPRALSEATIFFQSQRSCLPRQRSVFRLTQERLVFRLTQQHLAFRLAPNLWHKGDLALII
jgi:hypothetical protein